MQEHFHQTVVSWYGHVEHIRSKAPDRSHLPTQFVYKNSWINFCDFFIYLGVYFHWKKGGVSAFEYREEKGWKALGAVSGQLQTVPFLPFARTVELGEALVGGAYLYGSEMWAPFISMVAVAEEKGSRDPVNTAYMKWITGMGGARLDRHRGWTSVRELDDKALVAAVRVFEDARKFQGLLGRAVYQLVLNWEHTWDSRRSETTWMGALLRRVRVVWPRFRVQLSTPLSWTGGPMLRVETKFSLARQFHEDLRIYQWQVRQCSVLNARPRESQHDFFLFHLLSALGSGSLREKLSLEQPVTVTDTISTPIFAELPTVSTESFRILLRTLAGLEDFARTNANCFRRAAHPRLHHSTWDRSCLHCFYHHEQFYLDSEWHSFLECPLVRSPRREFVLLTKLHTFFENDCSVENFALLVARVREDKHLVNALARFARQIHDLRQCWFRQLSSEATKQRLAEMLETRFNI